MSQPLLLLSCGLVLMLVAIGVVLRRLARAERLQARLVAFRPSGAQTAQDGDLFLPVRLLLGLGQWLRDSGLLSSKTLVAFEASVASAGFKGVRALPLFLAAKALVLTALPLLALLYATHKGMTSQNQLLLVAGSGVAGILLPDLVIGQVRKRYLAAIERGLGDALDLMVICAEAGLGLDTSLERVSNEMRPSNRALSTEFALTVNEMRILPDRRRALMNMGERTGLVGLKRLGSTLAQTLQYGTPLTQALRTLAAEMRQMSLTRFEERAARLPVLLTLPMILFILPCVFLIVGGPAMLRILDVMARR